MLQSSADHRLPDSATVRAQLCKILAWSGFRTRHAEATQTARFFSFIVEETLEGRSSDLKEYNIAVDLLKRPRSFDPREDSIVRVEANRLRKALKSYYEGAGAFDPIVIEVPRGKYVPNFVVLPRQAAATVASDARLLPAEATAPDAGNSVTQIQSGPEGTTTVPSQVVLSRADLSISATSQPQVGSRAIDLLPLKNVPTLAQRIVAGSNALLVRAAAFFAPRPTNVALAPQITGLPEPSSDGDKLVVIITPGMFGYWEAPVITAIERRLRELGCRFVCV